MSEFFKPPSRKPSLEELPQAEWTGPPRSAVPAVVPVDRVILRTEEVGLYLSCFWVYPTGFEFEVFVVTKDEWSDLDPFSFDHHYKAEQRGEIPPEKLRLGLEFADGSTVTNTGDFDWDWEPGPTPKSPRMSGSGGGGGGGSWQYKFWVWPLPSPGLFDFVCEWPAARIPLTRVELDADLLLEAASRSQDLFPSIE
jgi:hypothetical protein